MSFKLSIDQITQLFNPDSVHRGVSIGKLKNLGKITALESMMHTSYNKGLVNNPKDHVKRKAFYGSNQRVVRKTSSFLQILSKQFQDQLIRLLAAAGFVSLVLGILAEGIRWGWVEGFSIFLAVILVVGVESIDDFLHQREFQTMKGREQQQDVRVYRSGKLYQLPPNELMVGDVIQIMSGDRIKVDGLLVSGQELTFDQSEITGEAAQVRKRVPLTYQRQEGADPFILSSTTVVHGMGIMLVMAVGRHSYYGRQLSKIHGQDSQSPLKSKISDLSDGINENSMIVGFITFFSLIMHYIYECYNDDNPLQAFLSFQTMHKLVEAILVTFTIDVALPQSLPLSVTFALANSANQLQKSNIFVKRLSNAQTMGGIDELLIAKTGFITKNLLSVSEIYVQDRITNVISRETMSEDTCRILNLGIVMNTVACPTFIEEGGRVIKMEHIGNKTQSALLQMAFRMGYNYERFRVISRVKRIYSSGHYRKKMATVYRDQTGKLYLFVKGSTAFLLPYCSYHINKNQQIQVINASAKAKIQEAINHFGRSNLRTLTLAYKEVNSIPNKWSQVERNLILTAIVGIKDIVRKGVSTVVQSCKNSGINVRMLSNEGRYTAIGTAKEAGILSNNWVEKEIDYTLVEGCDFRDLIGGVVKQSEENKKRALQNFNVIKDSLKIIFRASEQDKYILTQALKMNGHVVAVAGSGTNDSQAMRKADVSLAMASTANHVAKQAADIIFFDNSFGAIVKTIKWGRHVFLNVKKFLVLQLTINLVAAMITLLGAVFLGQGPLHPLQMLWTNLLIQVLGSIAIIVEHPRAGELSYPYSRRDKILTLSMLKLIGYQTLFQVICLSVILFQGPQILGITSSVQTEIWSKMTAKHYTIVFNTFVLFQIFNQFNVRQLSFKQLNVFEGLLHKPLFLCFIVTTMTMQMALLRYGGRMMHVTELTLKENLFCLIVGSISLLANFLTKVAMPTHFAISKNGLEIGYLRIPFRKKVVDNNEVDAALDLLASELPNLEMMSLQFCSFLIKKKTKNKIYSYLDPLQTLKSYQSEQQAQEEANPVSRGDPHQERLKIQL